MASKSVIFYETTNPSTFLKVDVNELLKDHQVIQNQLNWGEKYKTISHWFQQIFFLLNNYNKITTIICSFAGPHSLIPIIISKIKGIPSFIIINGTEVVAIKELGYGSLLKTPLKYFIYFSIRNATEIWPVSKYLIEGESTFTDTKFKFGIKHFYPNLKVRYTVIPNGVEEFYWRLKDNKTFKKPLNYIAVVSGISQYTLKGIDLLVNTFSKLKNLKLKVIGINQSDIGTTYSNIEFLGRLSKDQLLKEFDESHIYLQLSLFEGFGISLAEAMSCGLIPIGSSVCAIPDIIGNSGYILQNKNINDLIDIISEIENESQENLKIKSQLASNLIKNNYQIKSRIQQMNTRIESYKK